jgi:hypothetical protein
MRFGALFISLLVLACSSDAEQAHVATSAPDTLASLAPPPAPVGLYGEWLRVAPPALAGDTLRLAADSTASGVVPWPPHTRSLARSDYPVACPVCLPGRRNRTRGLEAGPYGWWRRRLLPSAGAESHAVSKSPAHLSRRPDRVRLRKIRLHARLASILYGPPLRPYPPWQRRCSPDAGIGLVRDADRVLFPAP